jgi:hypothetical protein
MAKADLTVLDPSGRAAGLAGGPGHPSISSATISLR